MKQIELKEKRKAREKHFLQENGEVIAQIYDEDIHYLKNGKFEEIDNNLIKRNNKYINKQNKFRTYFDNSKNTLMTIKSDSNEIKINLKNCNDAEPVKNKCASKLFSKILYKNILKNIDFEYTIMPSKVKENIILKTKNASNNELVFILETNLNLKLSEDKTILASDNSNTKFIIEAPYMIDSNGKANKNIFYELTKLENNYELKLIIDKEWLNDKNTKYPVIIDPTITNQGKTNSVYDTYIYSGDTNVTRYDKDILKVGVEKVNGIDRVNRALLKFDLPEIGTGSQIIDARLHLVGYPILGGSYDKKIITVHQITEDWQESTAKWSTMYNKFNPRVENCFNSSRSFQNIDNTVTPSLNTCIITNLVKKWYSNTPNYGIMLKLNEEVYTNDILPSFFSKNNDVTGDNPKPILSITYRNQNGLENYMKYYNQSLSQGTIYQNLYNGNVTTVFDIGSTIGGKLPASLSIIYNTNDVVLNNDLGYGLGYRLSLHQTIKEVVIDETNYLEYIDADGTIHYFKENDNKYKDEDGLNLTIIKSTNDYIMTDKEGNNTKFIKINNVGYLKECIDVSKNKIIVTYNEENKITKITDANNNEINLLYEENKITVISPDETLYLNYSNNKLINMTTITGITSFTYDNKNVISNITDESGIKFTYEYYEQKPYRIKKVTEYGLGNEEGNSINFTYDFNTTKIIDKRNKTEITTFNSQGNPVSVIYPESLESIKNAYGKKEVYGEYLEQKNKLISSILPEKHVKNYLSNTSFEEETIKFASDNLTISITDETSYSGLKSLKLTSNDINKEATYSIAVPKGNYYTFSSYTKNTNDIKLILSYQDENNETITSESQLIKTNSSFKREEVTIYYPEAAISNITIRIILLTEGTTYIDNIQLEEGEVANSYNYVENSDFSGGLEGWVLKASDSTNEELSTNGIFEVANVETNLKALKINMNPKNSTEVEKRFKINGKAGEIYNVSFWYKSSGVKEPDITLKNNYACIYFVYEDDFINGHEAWSEQLNSDCEEWQYCTAYFLSEDDFTAIKLKFNQYFNANEVYITNIGVYKDLRNISYIYDENGNIKSIKGLNKEIDEFNYDSNNQLIKMTNPMGKNFTFEYDNVVTDRALSGTSKTGIKNEYIYDENGNPVTSRITNIKQNEEIINGLYKIRAKGTYKYLKNKNNLIILEEDRCGHNKWNIEKIEDYYRINHIVTTDKYINVQNNKVVLSNNSDDNSLFTFIKNDNNSYLIKSKNEEKYLVYDQTLKLKELEENNPNFEFYFEETTYETFIENSAEYTEDGRFVKKTINNRLNEVIYDTDEVTGLIKSITNPNNVTTNYTYNDKKQITKVRSKDKEVSYSYNTKNLLEKITLGNKEYNFVYDNFLNKKEIKIGENITLITNNYEENNGKLLSSTYGNNNTVSFSYDKFDRIKTLTKMNDTYNYKYGNNGDLLKVISNNDIINFIYDSAKRLHEYRTNDFRINYNYNENNNIESKTYNLDNINHSVSNEFNSEDAIIKTTFDDNNSINYSYDELGRIINKNISNEINTNYNYVTNGNRTTLLIKDIVTNSDKYSYKYDKLDNITHIYHNNELINKYFYDDYNQLIKENDYKNNITIKYEYDDFGNILTKQKYKLNDYNLLEKNTYEYNNNNWEDQLTKFNDEEITYDQIGNPLIIGNKTLTWINGRELNSYTDENNTILYKYNQNGIRTSKIVNGIETKYYLEGNSIILEKTDNNVIYYMRDIEGNLEGLKYNGKIYHYMKNIQNDIISIVDDNYNQIATYEYDSWGNVITLKDSNNNIITDQNHIAHINPFRYRSYYYDKETKLYYLNSRYYNPVWGRFINVDGYLSTSQEVLGYNMYVYVINNPINSFDYSGKAFKKFWDKIVKKTKEIINTISTQLKNIKNNFAFEIGTGTGIGASSSTIISSPSKKTNNSKNSAKPKSSRKIGLTGSFYTEYDVIGYKHGNFYTKVEKVNSVTVGPISCVNGFSTAWIENEDGEKEEWETLTVKETKQPKCSISIGDEFATTIDETSIFIGYAAEFHFFIGGHIKIGWEIDY